MIKFLEDNANCCNNNSCCSREKHTHGVLIETCDCCDPCHHHTPVPSTGNSSDILNEIKKVLDKLETIKSPYIGANGNWFYFDKTKLDWVDSGVKAQGTKGDNGDAGLNATINGLNAIKLASGKNISITQVNDNTTISCAGTCTGGDGALIQHLL